MSDSSSIANLLRTAHTIAVVGLSDKRWQLSARADDLAAGSDAAFAFVVTGLFGRNIVTN